MGEPCYTGTEALRRAAIESLADRLVNQPASWLPLTGHVRNITFTLNEAELISDILRASINGGAQASAMPPALDAAIHLINALRLGVCPADVLDEYERKFTEALEVVRASPPQSPDQGFVCPKCGKHGKGGWICPHRKVSLGSVLVVDGIIVCPLHGLKIDAATGIAMAPAHRESGA